MGNESYYTNLSSQRGDYTHIDTRFQEAAKPLTDEEIEEMDKKEEAEYKKR